MKLSEIQVGGRYRAKVSGSVEVVRIVDIKQVPPVSRSARDTWRTIIVAVNEATGRRISVRSPQRLRKRVSEGCEFCRQPFNRPDGGFTCQYCGKTWPGTEG